MPSSLVTAFRQQFPEGSLLSEVLTIHDGLFVVRVSIAIKGAVLSQALAANNSLELAEDMACNRALERLVFLTSVDTLPSTAAAPATKSAASQPTQPVSPAAVQTPGTPPLPVSQAEVAAKPRTEVELSIVPPPTPTTDRSVTDDGHGQPQTQSRGDLPSPGPPEPPRPDLKPTTHPSPKSENVAPDFENGSNIRENWSDFGNMAAAPIDLSDIIAQTDVELQRLGWDVNQGREFLETTYGKRSRHDLTDEELLEFLLYLESQPLPSA